MNRRNVESIYPLTPIQEGLLFHRLHHPESDLGFLQIRCLLKGKLEVDSFESAWSMVVKRHSVLRTSIHWEELDRPLQVVHRVAEPSLQRRDLRKTDPMEQEVALQSFLEEDREKRLDLSKAPVMRLSLIQTADNTFRFIWSCHHILLDGWSGALAFNEVFECYGKLRQKREIDLPTPRPYIEFATWIRQHDWSAAESYWRHLLKGYRTPNSIASKSISRGSGGQSAAVKETGLDLPSQLTQDLKSMVERHQLSLNTVIQGAWALILSRYYVSEDVVFGATVSGRTAPLKGLESMLGVFVNFVPVRVRVTQEIGVSDWLRDIMARNVEVREFENTPFPRIKEWSEVPGRQGLFETLLITENYPWEGHFAVDGGLLVIDEFRGDVTTDFPLNLITKPGQKLSLALRYDPRFFESGRIESILAALQHLIEGVVSEPDRQVSDLVRLVTADDDFLPKDSEVVTSVGTSETERDLSTVSPRRDSDAVCEEDAMPPQDVLELQLIRLWERVIGIEPIGIEDDFFELGGTSLVALQLIDEIESSLGKRIPLDALLQKATIEHQAKILRRKKWSPPWTTVVPIQPKGSRPPLFVIPPYATSVILYNDLARYLGSEQPTFGLAAWGLDGEHPPYSEMDGLVDHLIKEVQKVRPHGPYFFGGYSFGGRVAYEMACQLDVRGCGTAVVALFDTHGPGYPNYLFSESVDYYLLGGHGRHLDNLRKKPIGYPIRLIRNQIRKLRSKFRRIEPATEEEQKGGGEHELALSPGESAHTRKRMIRFEDPYSEEFASYEPGIYPGKVTVFRGTSQPKIIFADRTLGWGNLASGGVEVIEYVSTHSVSDRSARNLAAKLKPCLERAQAASPEDSVGP